jgi:Leucine-rich repeat (LRR) protein
MLFFLMVLFVGLPATCSLAQTTPADSVARMRTYTDLGRAIADGPNVYRLKLTKKKLRAVPPEVFQLTNLEYLNLSNNKIRELPSAISQLSKLNELSLSSNKLQNLPSQIGELKELKVLNLNKNLLETLPPQIGRLQQLIELFLWSNELDDLPDEIAQCTSLKTLELRGILFNAEDHKRFSSLLPDTEILMSPPCNCK